MLRFVASCGLAAIAWAQPQGSVLYDEKTHQPSASGGCGKPSPYQPGKTTVAQGTYAGATWTYRVYVPSYYDGTTPMALVIQHPGWGMSAQGEESGAGITGYAESRGFFSITAQGADDNNNWGGPWYSWNAVGSTQSPGQAGPTCTSAANNPDYCYDSCGYCSDQPQCDWTTCRETVTKTGTGRSAGGFIPGLLDTLEDQLCVDTTREFAAGESNGGMQTYQLGVVLGHRLAAVAPQFGSFARGFNMVPEVGLPVIDLHGTSDTTVPANVSLSGDGYYYTPVHEIFNGNEYSTGWKEVNGCEGPGREYDTPLTGQKGLWCVLEGYCRSGDVVRCSWDGGHNWLFNDPKANGELVTGFLTKWAKLSHIGHGFSKGETMGPGQPLTDVRILDEESQLAAEKNEPYPDFPRTLQAESGRNKHHYGNPDRGCLPDEDEVSLGTGSICAPRIAANLSSGVPVPQCRLGGARPSHNGCPTDAAVPRKSTAWPICMARGHTDDPYVNGEFHCFLVCPCAGNDGRGGCGKESHGHCPHGSTCERSDLRNRGQGVCTYSSTSTASPEEKDAEFEGSSVSEVIV